MESNNLRGLIVSKYRTIRNFGRHLNWSSRKTYDIVNGKQEATGKDIEAMCIALDVEIPPQMRELFFDP
jgi:hypothetical protein